MFNKKSLSPWQKKSCTEVNDFQNLNRKKKPIKWHQQKEKQNNIMLEI